MKAALISPAGLAKSPTMWMPRLSNSGPLYDRSLTSLNLDLTCCVKAAECHSGS